jgi:hypothetical protein
MPIKTMMSVLVFITRGTGYWWTLSEALAARSNAMVQVVLPRDPVPAGWAAAGGRAIELVGRNERRGGDAVGGLTTEMGREGAGGNL